MVRPLAVLGTGIFLLAGCGHPTTTVWVDLDRVMIDQPEAVSSPPSVPKAPGPVPAETFTLPGRTPEILAGPTTPGERRTVAVTEEDQRRQLDSLRRRLEAIYARQTDIYAAEQTRLMGDPELKAFQSVVQPKLRAAFQAYADKRTPLVVRLVNLSGFPDTNPRSLPPPAAIVGKNGKTTVNQRFWLEANDVRAQIAALDAEYDKTASELIAEVRRLGAADRLALLKKIQQFRNEMNERAIAEAASPLEAGRPIVTLSIQAEPAVVLPATAPKTLTVPGVPTASPAPKVDSQEARNTPVETRDLLQRQLGIWLALHDRVLARAPERGVPDVTREFESWRRQQQAGP